MSVALVQVLVAHRSRLVVRPRPAREHESKALTTRMTQSRFHNPPSATPSKGVTRVISTKLLACVMGAGLIVGAATPAFAGVSIFHAWEDAGTVGGHSYIARAAVHLNYGSNAQGGADIRTANGNNTGPGNMGAKATVHQGGFLCTASAWVYNDNYYVGIGNNTPVPDCGPGSYAGSGSMRARRSDGTYKQTDLSGTSYYQQDS